MKHAILLGLVALAAGCTGPDAPDAAVCQDLIHRLCLSPICPLVAQDLLPQDADCEATLLANTGCGDPGFQFTSPSRDRVLSCRAPLLDQGDQVDDHPACVDVDAALSCADVKAFLAGSGAPPAGGTP